MKLLGTPSITDPKGNIFVARSGSFLEKELLLKGFILSNEYLAFGYVIEGVPNSFLWVSYEDTFLRFGFELIRMKLLL